VKLNSQTFGLLIFMALVGAIIALMTWQSMPYISSVCTGFGIIAAGLLLLLVIASWFSQPSTPPDSNITEE